MLGVARGAGGQKTGFNWVGAGKTEDHEADDADIMQIVADLEAIDPETPPPAVGQIVVESDGPPAAPPEVAGQLCLAGDIMHSPVETLLPEADILEAWKLISERRFRHVPIVSSQGEVVGIVSDRDILLRAALIAASDAADLPSPGGRVEQIMHAPVLTATPSTAVNQVARIMFEERVGAMPIADEAGNLVGMITRNDILRTLVSKDRLHL